MESNEKYTLEWNEKSQCDKAYIRSFNNNNNNNNHFLNNNNNNNNHFLNKNKNNNNNNSCV